jgi:hypothetical protein
VKRIKGKAESSLLSNAVISISICKNRVKMRERALDSDEVLEKQIESLASVLSCIEHGGEEEEEEEEVVGDDENQTTVETFEKSHEVEERALVDYDDYESDDWADENVSYWWREEQKSSGEVRILERRRAAESVPVLCSARESRKVGGKGSKTLGELVSRIRELRMRAESIGRQAA